MDTIFPEISTVALVDVFKRRSNLKFVDDIVLKNQKVARRTQREEREAHRNGINLWKGEMFRLRNGISKMAKEDQEAQSATKGEQEKRSVLAI